MVVLFVPRSLLHGDEGEIGPDVVRHLVGVELSSSFAVAATSVAREQRPAGSTQLPAELLQTILDRVDPPPGWPSGALRVLAEIRGTASGQGGAGMTAEPDLAGIRLCMRPDGSAATIRSLVLFDRPNPGKHHFLALDPIRLRFATADTSLPEPFDEASKRDCRTGLVGATDVINAAFQIDVLVQAAIRRPFGLTIGETYVAEPSLLGRRARLAVRRGAGLIGGAILALLDDSLLPGLPPLKDVSAFCHQLSLRTRQAVTLSEQLPSLRRSVPPAREVAAARAAYIGFFNTVWLVLNDMIVGQALGRLIGANERSLTDGLAWAIKTLTVELPLDLLVWLDDWPAGLKLNTELSAAASSALTALVRFWDAAILDRLVASLPTVFRLGSFVGLLGASALIALAADLLSLATGHLYLAYLGSTVTYRWMARLLGGLFDVFRGKRRNVLRRRLDSTTYTVDQLLVGTLLFTTLVFLFPTVLAYYLLVACGRAAVVLGHATLETALACVNHWPLFAIMLRVKAPARLPGGVQVQPTRTPGVFDLRTKPLPMSALLKQHLLLAVRILSVHYSPVRLVRAFVRGEIVSPLSTPRTAGAVAADTK